MRPSCLFLLALAVSCAEDTKPGPGADDGSRKPTAGTRTDPEPVAPATGIPQIQKDHDDCARDLAELARQERTETRDKWVRRQIKRLENLILATEMMVAGEARQGVNEARRRLNFERGKLQSRRVMLSAEMREIDAVLEASDKGLGIPPGFSEAEFRDKLADKRLEDGELREREAEIVAALAKQEKLLSAEEIPPAEDSLATRELAALRDLKRKAEGLLR